MKQRDILLVPFPFSDQSGKKVRPIIVISNNEFNEYSEDLIVIGITSNFSKDKHTLNLSDKDLEEGNLYHSCCVKVENILKLDKSLIIKKIGKIKKEKLIESVKILNKIIN